MSVSVTESSADLPFVSVIMPVRNEEDFISRSLGAVLAQDYPHELLEVRIVDGNSDDRTREIVEELASRSSIEVAVLDNPKRIAPSALNIGIANSRGDIIVRVDGHCEIAPDYVSQCVKHLASGKADGVGGPIETVGETLQSQAIAIAMSSRFGVGGSAFRTTDGKEMYVDTVAFPGYKRTTLESAGPFNEELVRNQDDEFNYRIRKKGGRILLTPDIRSVYYSRSDLRSLWKQYFQYGYWKVRVMQLHPRQMSLRQFVPFAFVATITLLAAASFFSSYALFALGGIVSVYLAAALAAALISSKGRSVTLAACVFAGIVILHISYGLGFALGLAAFWNRWGSEVLSPERESDARA